MQIYKNICLHLCGYGRYFKKHFVFLAYLLSITAFATAQTEKISIAGSNTSLEKYFKSIKEQTGYSFAFSSSKFDSSRKMTLSMQNAELGNVLETLLQNTGYTYNISDGRIFLLPAKSPETTNIRWKEIPPKPGTASKQDSLLQTQVDTAPVKDMGTMTYNILKPDTSVSGSVTVSQLDTGNMVSQEVTDLSIVYRNMPARSFTPLPRLAVKSNLLHDLTGSLNLGVEVRTGSKYTLDLSVTYNPWTYSEMKKFNVIAVQPEFRYWTCEPFHKHFFGLHATYANFNVVGIGPSTYMKDHLLKGDLYGAGISYGYHWYLSPRWSMEGTLGVGYLHLKYDESECKGCLRSIGNRNKNYFGPTKVGVSLIYMLK
ncbi:MAG TPA: DUF3575 domain-containing protein [Bacteroides reticulotermitis]|nr:DUF3575 domain-containing protein [Bacteroides reticulotermitis]